MFKNTDLMYSQSVVSSLVAAKIASSSLNSGGLLSMTGATPCLDGTAGMIGYGMAKAAVHHLVKSLAEPVAGGLPSGVTTLAICPVTLDTAMNRKV
jgi:dihydropteridine reductase